MRDKSFALGHRHPWSRLALLAAVVSLLSVAVVADKLPEAPVKPLTTPDPALWEKDIEAFRKLVTDLAAPEMEGRGPGTEGADKARDYLVAEFKALGLQPAFRSDKKSEITVSYTQPFEISTGAKAKTQELVLVDEKGEAIITPRVGELFSARGFSGNGKFDGELVFVGYAITNEAHEYDSFAGMDENALKGKVAVAYRYEPMDKDNKPVWVKDAKMGQWTRSSSLIEKAKWAAGKGAAALIVVDPPSMQKEGGIPSVASTQGGGDVDIPLIQVAPEVFNAMLRAHGKGEKSFAEQLQRDNNDKAQPAFTFENVKAKGEIELVRTKAIVHNVAAYLPGWGKLKDDILVIGGHYDHLGLGGPGARGGEREKEQIYHGADDNASGTAGVVMLARRIVGFDRAPSGPARSADSLGHRTVLFVCFAGEERGLLGSAYMCKHPDEVTINGKDPITLEQISLMLNLDMIGRMKGNKLIAVGVGSGEKLDELITESANGIDLDLNLQGTAGGGSDHMSFHARSIPAVHFYTGVHNDYHKPSDTAEKIEAEGGAKTVSLLASMTLNYWEREAPIKYIKTRMAHPAAGGPRGSGAYLGILPNYESIDAETGCAIDGVSDGSPAAEAGLKADDVITMWDKTPIKNLVDLSNALKECKPGQTVTLKVKRGAEAVDVKVKLGTR